MRAIQLTEFGGPEVLQLVELDKPEPKDGEVLIRVERVGVNFADTHQRENTYLSKFEVPLVLGGEAAGVREDTGERVIAMIRSGGFAGDVGGPEGDVYPIPGGGGGGPPPALPIPGPPPWHPHRPPSH